MNLTETILEEYPVQAEVSACTFTVQDKREYSAQAEEVVLFPWWLLALLGGVGGIILVGGVVVYQEEKRAVNWNFS